MAQKIFNLIRGVTLTVLLITLAIITWVLYSHFADRQFERLRMEMRLAVRGVELSGEEYLDGLEGEDFRAQIEYQPYYAGEDFDAHVKGLQEKYRGFGEVRYAHLSGVKYLDGDGVCLCFPIPGDRHSCVLMQLFKVKKDDDEPIEALPERASVRALLDTAKIEVRR